MTIDDPTRLTKESDGANQQSGFSTRLAARLRRMFGDDPLVAYENLPTRVRQAIEDQEARAEILIGWIQLAIVMTFAVLYSLAAKPIDAGMAAFQPVPFALAGYVIFTVLRLVLAYRRFTPSWFLAFSIVIDVAMLFGLIWSFHLQYDQPPAFYLKVPTLLYVFIFIAIRALRFDPRYVLTAGLVAAGGWLLLLLYAVMAAPSPEVITRDFTEYLTSNMVLLGAEFDKVISILLVAGILTLALARARRLLVASVRESTAAGDLKRFFSPEIADAITQSSHQLAAGEGEAREAAVLMVDIRGFTRFAAGISPGDVVRLLAGYQAAVLPVIREQGGTVDKFLGDGIMVTFGAARPMADPAAAALRVLETVVTDVAESWNATRAEEGYTHRLTLKGSVTTGRVVYGAVGDASRLEFTVIGDAVNLAAKLEKHTAVESALALTTENTWDLALSQG
ncbi:MAG: adenylate/guanylate cyclase domain-containing protein, partial [Pseudomonadota bacterium]